MNNQVVMKVSGAAIPANWQKIAKLFAAMNNVQPFSNGAGFDQMIVIDLFYAPSDVVIAPDQNLDAEIADYTPAWFVRRQDLKSAKVQQLSKAIEGEGLIVHETTENQYEQYFSNSAAIKIDNGWIRYGVSNFTQTEDNDPFNAVTEVFYYEID